VSLGAAGHLPGYFSMKSNRWVFIILALLAGTGIGLAYGWSSIRLISSTSHPTH
jgi:hypothetical protein